MANNIDWIIHMVANEVACEKCGATTDSFPQFIGDFHTHGMRKYGHPDFQLVLNLDDQLIGYVLNTLGLRVQKGEQFKAGNIVNGIFESCPVRLDEFQEADRTVLRVIVPDSHYRFPEDPECEYPYSFQSLPMEQLKKSGGNLS